MRKGTFMRKTNKKHSGLLTKSGVILVTIIFIVALSLIFITTALMISIAGRQRVYTNAMNSQARLTVTSLSQMIWQAIYSQQITDRDLVALANGTGHGSVVVFEDSDLPGMGLGDSDCSAYFYCLGAGNKPNKIGIECRCSIDGITEYYTLVLERHKGEDAPPKMFNFVVNLGEGGVLDRSCFGMDAVTLNNSRSSMARFDADDNVVFIHKPTTNSAEGLGFYSTTLTDGYLRCFDSVIAADVFCLGADSGLMFGNNPNLIAAGSTGSVYFWGSSNPLVQSTDGGATINTITSQINWNSGIENLYFDSIETTDESGNVTYTGFEDFDTTIYANTLSSVTGNFYYDRDEVRSHLSYDHDAERTSSVWSSDPGQNWVSSLGMDSYLTTDPALIDTIDELEGPLGYQAEIAEAYEDGHELDIDSVASISGGTYLVDANATITSTINVDLSGGDVVIVVDDGTTININKNGYIVCTSGGDGELIFLLQSGAQIVFNQDSDNNCGIYDVDCYRSGTTDYFDGTNLDQTKIPRCRIFSLYTGGTPVKVSGNAGGKALTAFLGFYPQSDPNGTGGGAFEVNAAGVGFVYYGRISAGRIIQNGASPLLIPYCPNDPESVDVRNTAYRDLTDFAVVPNECGYFTYG